MVEFEEGDDSQLVTLSRKDLNFKAGGVVSLVLYKKGRLPPPIDNDMGVFPQAKRTDFKYLQQAERLVFVTPQDTLDIEVEFDQDTYAPG